jgi:hypothetical protein
MSTAERLLRKAYEYEVLAASHSERGAFEGGSEHVAAATAFTVTAIILREIAAVLDDEAEAA